MQLPKFEIAGRELAAFAKQAWLMRHDVGRPVFPANTEPGDHVVVCLHGLFATAGVLRPLREQLEKHPGIHTATLSYPVGPGVKPLARRLGELLSELPSDVSLHLLGHSLGGVVVRYFAQEIGDPRIVQTISLGAPFAGVRGASWVGLELTRDLAPSSSLLRALQLGSRRRLATQHLSIVAENDQVVSAPMAHALPGGDVTLVRRCGHNALLYHEQAIAAVERRVRGA